jgi:hypothetical protein
MKIARTKILVFKAQLDFSFLLFFNNEGLGFKVPINYIDTHIKEDEFKC